MIIDHRVILPDLDIKRFLIIMQMIFICIILGGGLSLGVEGERLVVATEFIS